LSFTFQEYNYYIRIDKLYFTVINNIIKLEDKLYSLVENGIKVDKEIQS